MKKKLIILACLLITAINASASGIVPENFLMERLIMIMDTRPTYISKKGKDEVKAIKIDKNIMKFIDTKENPFYIYDSDGKKQLVRQGDYLISSPKLSSIYVISKKEFESNFRNKSAPQKSIKTADMVLEHERVNFADVDAGMVVKDEF